MAAPSLTCDLSRNPGGPSCGDSSLHSRVFLCPKGKGCALCDRPSLPPREGGDRGLSLAAHPLGTQLHLENSRHPVLAAGGRISILREESCALCPPPPRGALAEDCGWVLLQGDLLCWSRASPGRWLGGQVAEGRPGVRRAPRWGPAAPAGTDLLALLQCAFPSRPVGLSCDSCRAGAVAGAGFRRSRPAAFGGCGGPAFRPDLSLTGVL